MSTNTIPNWLPDPVKTCIVQGAHLVEFDESTGECHACGCNESAEWDLRLDEQGPIAGTELPAETNGWERRDVWVGDHSTGDETIGWSYCASYRNGDRAIDLTYFVTGHHQSYDVELCSRASRVDDNGEPVGDDEEVDYSNPFDFGFTEYEQALWAARNGATRDERFKLG